MQASPRAESRNGTKSEGILFERHRIILSDAAWWG